MDWTKIKEKHPKAFEKWYDHSGYALCDFRELYDFFDEQGIYINVFFTAHWTKQDESEYRSYFDWDMYDENFNNLGSALVEESTRTEAETEAFEYAFNILEKRLCIICHKCNIEMKEGDALQNTSVMGMPDFEGQTDIKGQTFYYGGTGKLIKVFKCSNCGHSISKGTLL